MQKLLTPADLTEVLGIKISTVYAWVHQKKIPYVKIGSKLKFIPEQIDDFIKSNNVDRT